MENLGKLYLCDFIFLTFSIKTNIYICGGQLEAGGHMQPLGAHPVAPGSHLCTVECVQYTALCSYLLPLLLCRVP